MEHNLFKPSSFEEAKHAAVGDCNGFSMKERWDKETPEFARAIVKQITSRNDGGWAQILDYGCGPGRLAKEVSNRDNKIKVMGTDASTQMMVEATKWVGDPYIFQTIKPEELKNLDYKFDVVYCVYVLQHCPAIDLRDAIRNIYNALKDDGVFVYCSSDYRMCIRFDGGGFFDDRFLGVNIREEIGKLFKVVGPLFDNSIYESNLVVKKMVTGCDNGLPHPAFIYKKKTKEELANGTLNEVDKEIIVKAEKAVEDFDKLQEVEIKPKSNPNTVAQEVKKILMVNRLAPGDILVMTNAIRDLHKAYPNRFKTDVRTPCNEIFQNNPYITSLNVPDDKYNKAHSIMGKKEGYFTWIDDVLAIDMQYPLIHTSGESGRHFCEGHREFLETVLNLEISQTSLTPELYLSQTERDWASPVTVKKGFKGKYWVINAGSKGDYTLKQYPYYQEVVDLLKDQIKFVQIGEKSHNHIPLNGVINMVGQTNIRELIRLIYKAEGVLTCVSLPMHIAAVFRKPCVVVAGAREGTRWELYPNQQFLYVNGCLPCATYDGCWKSKQDDCKNKVNSIARCMTLITPEDVVRSISRYYEGAMLSF